jgi:dihydropteroate synthase
MGILNVTPDSFADGGRYFLRDAALRHAEQMLGQGADLLDVGGESTRPGADDVPEQEELDRVLPVLEGLRDLTGVPVSVDTSRPAVMRAAVGAGVAMLNDVRALQAPGALAAAADLAVPVCLMHMQGQPRTMQSAPGYEDVCREVAAFLEQRMQACVDAGIPANYIMLDPGFGFGKSFDHNIELLANLRELTRFGRPLLVGLSRKSLLGALTGRKVEDRVAASVAAAVLAVQNGADIVRVHDVAETVDALRVVRAVVEAGTNA